MIEWIYLYASSNWEGWTFGYWFISSYALLNISPLLNKIQLGSSYPNRRINKRFDKCMVSATVTRLDGGRDRTGSLTNVNSLPPGRCCSKNLTNQMATLVQVTAWPHQSTSHHLSQFGPRSMSSYGVTMSQCVTNFAQNIYRHQTHTIKLKRRLHRPLVILKSELDLE